MEFIPEVSRFYVEWQYFIRCFSGQYFLMYRFQLFEIYTYIFKWWSTCECYIIVFILSSSSRVMLTLHTVCPPHCPFRALSDLNKDGKMDQQEFSIAMKLIKLKLQGQQLPVVLPPIMKQPPMFSPLISARFGMYLWI